MFDNHAKHPGRLSVKDKGETDEPTDNLDSEHGEEVMNLLTELHESGTTVIMVTHAPEYAEYAERTVHLFKGKIVPKSTMISQRRKKLDFYNFYNYLRNANV